MVTLGKVIQYLKKLKQNTTADIKYTKLISRQAMRYGKV